MKSSYNSQATHYLRSEGQDITRLLPNTRFIAAVWRGLKWSPSWIRQIDSTFSHSASFKIRWIVSSHFRVNFPSNSLILLDFRSKYSNVFLYYQISCVFSAFHVSSKNPCRSESVMQVLCVKYDTSDGIMRILSLHFERRWSLKYRVISKVLSCWILNVECH